MRSLRIRPGSGVARAVVRGELEGLYRGEPASAERAGPGDLALRLGVNLLGAKAMSQREFAGF